MTRIVVDDRSHLPGPRFWSVGGVATHTFYCRLSVDRRRPPARGIMERNCFVIN